MQGCDDSPGYNIDWEPSWCRPYSHSIVDVYLMEQVTNIRVVVRPLCNNHYRKDELLLNFRHKDNNVSSMHVQPYYYRVRQAEPCHHKGTLPEQSISWSYV